MGKFFMKKVDDRFIYLLMVIVIVYEDLNGGKSCYC